MNDKELQESVSLLDRVRDAKSRAEIVTLLGERQLFNESKDSAMKLSQAITKFHLFSDKPSAEDLTLKLADAVFYNLLLIEYVSRDERVENMVSAKFLDKLREIQTKISSDT